MWWPLILTYIFKVIQPWLRKSCPLCSVYSSGWILLYLSQMITIISGCVAFYFFQDQEIHIFGEFWNFTALTFKKTTVLDGLFPYLAQMITGMRGCVADNDLWPWTISSRSFGLGPENRWPISSRSFGLGPENRVRSVSSTILDGFFPYWVQMITSIRRCVTWDDLWPWPISSRSFDLTWIIMSALQRFQF